MPRDASLVQMHAKINCYSLLAQVYLAAVAAALA